MPRSRPCRPTRARSCWPGGHSLLPQMKLRFAMPTKLIDIGRLHDLSYVREDGGGVAIGALTRYHDLEALGGAPTARPDRGLRGRPGRRSAGPAYGDDRRLGRARRSGRRHAVGAARTRCDLRGDGVWRDARDRGRRHVPRVVPIGARERRGADRDPRAEDAGRLELSEVHPAGPGLGGRGRGGGADERQRERVAHEHGAHPDARHRRGGGPRGRGRPGDRRRAGRRRVCPSVGLVRLRGVPPGPLKGARSPRTGGGAR